MTICMKCKNWISADILNGRREHLCKAIPKPEVWDYITGKRINDEHEKCKKVNTDGNCEFYIAKEEA